MAPSSETRQGSRTLRLVPTRSLSTQKELTTQPSVRGRSVSASNGSYNTAVGEAALFNNAGDYNAAIGLAGDVQ